MQFAFNIKKLREQNKLSQKDIADYLGVTRQAVNSYECGRREPDYQTLVKLADFFSVTVDFLLGRTSHKNVNYSDINESHEGNQMHFQMNHFNYELDFMDPMLLKWIQNKNNLQYIKLARDIENMKLPLESIKSILDVLKSVQDRT